MRMRRRTFIGPVALCLIGAPALGQGVGDIEVSVTNEGNSDFFLTPVWFAFQDGNFDLFNLGDSASTSLEDLAEEGIVGGLADDFTNSGVPGNVQGVAANPAGFGGAPIIDPGETATAFVTPMDPADHQYFSFASMVIPSNDTFIGNESATAHRVFDDNGNLIGAGGVFMISIFGSDIFDAGTEVNNGIGAAFSVAGGVGTDEFGLVAAGSDLSSIIGLDTPAGTTVTDAIGAGELLATIRISIVPSPSTGVLLGFGVLAAMRRRRA